MMTIYLRDQDVNSDDLPIIRIHKFGQKSAPHINEIVSSVI